MGNEKFQIGKSRVIQDGDDCTIFVTGGILEEAQLAAERLKELNITTRIISMHTIKPIDKKAIINAYNTTRLIVTLEEHTIYGGLGSAIAEVLVDNHLTGKKVLRIGLEDGFSSIVGSQKYLRKCYNMDSNSIFIRASKVFFN